MSLTVATRSERSDETMTIRFGAQFWSQSVSWSRMREAGLAAETAGWDSLWTWDHLYAPQGPWEQPILEGWSLLAGLAALTSRIRIGLLVGANTFRNPGLTAKLATTLDHISAGRAVLGVGGAWFQREHEAFGIDFGSGFGERLDRLDEAVMLMRRLLDGERFSHDGRFYHLVDAVCAPRPVQARLPILVGGQGPRKTLRTVATYADAWNYQGSLEDAPAAIGVLHDHCREVGRDPGEIEQTASFVMVLRDDRAAADTAYAGLLAHNRIDEITIVPKLLGPPDEVAERLRPFVALGFRTIIVRVPSPFDDQTIERIGEVRARLEQ
jgi:F420-dependent oxidoreductase-like protein